MATPSELCVVTLVETSVQLPTVRLTTTTGCLEVLLNNVLRRNTNNYLGASVFAHDVWDLHLPLRAAKINVEQDSRNTKENHRRRGQDQDTGAVLCGRRGRWGRGGGCPRGVCRDGAGH